MTITRESIEMSVEGLQSDLALLDELRPHLPLEEAARGRAKDAIATAADVITAVQKLLVKTDDPPAGELASDALHAAANALDAPGGVRDSIERPPDTLSRAALYVLSQVSLDMHELQGEWDIWLDQNPDALQPQAVADR
jgi:hypothetical protein